ncbi:STAS domain-containing protein [Seohaeicola zhoushanensis]|uniref:MlaB-like STAS domain-containing protein n=1 Tax=Seohaeicola zhoushanensis TaxID=1569283 RepID=A0A8J3GWH1_9RHOB|nr:STAS domain-containing protein [Seohaeicola zhoushanensis]GHF48902.1 hypothetical protein GCM10017056_20560 [Seohaeicola zhoushanensis]
MTLRIDLGEKLDTAAVPALQAQLRQATGQPVQLEGGNLRLLGGLAAQMLLAAACRWERDGHRFEIHPSEALCDDLRRFGLDAVLLTQEPPK